MGERERERPVVELSCASVVCGMCVVCDIVSHVNAVLFLPLPLSSSLVPSLPPSLPLFPPPLPLFTVGGGDCHCRYEAIRLTLVQCFTRHGMVDEYEDVDRTMEQCLAQSMQAGAGGEAEAEEAAEAKETKIEGGGECHFRGGFGFR